MAIARRSFLGGLMAAAAAPLAGPHLVTSPQLLLPSSAILPAIGEPPAPPPAEPVIVAARALPLQALPLDVTMRRVELMPAAWDPHLRLARDKLLEHSAEVTIKARTDSLSTTAMLMRPPPVGYRLRLYLTLEPDQAG